MKIADKGTPYKTYGIDGSIHWYNPEGTLIMSVTGEKRMKHKHAELIHAWADGAAIQLSFMGDWIDMGEKFMWVDNSTYRIKPEEKKPVVRWLWAYRNIYGEWVMTELLSDEEANNKIFTFAYKKLEWSHTEFPE